MTQMADLWQRYRVQIILLSVGSILVLAGTIWPRLIQTDSPKIEIISSEASPTTIWVDIEGAIERPGVYELPGGSRLNDLLIKAGGLSVEADRDWVAQNLNLAQKLEDSQKVYIPQKSNQVQGRTSNSQTTSLINLNTASVSQLDTLWGIGEARAQQIIEGRPYLKIEDLLNRKIVPKNVYERIKNQISVY